MTSRPARSRAKDQLSAASYEAAKFAPLEQLCLCRNAASPRPRRANLLAEEEQWAKLARCVEVANEVWG
jgi:5-methyltetrahydropteroyltriglutamate--homocysteine methyltransferase